MLRTLTIRAFGALLLLSQAACTLQTSIRDLDPKASVPPPSSEDFDPKLKMSPGHMRAQGSTLSVRATVTPTDHQLYGLSMRAKVSINSQPMPR